jgi:hypothetical protein
LKYKYLCIYVGGSNPLFLALACISSQLTQLHVNCPENKRQFLLNIFPCSILNHIRYLYV